jgi:hypothetical protein
VRGYPLEMVLAEKVATAIARGTANTRWRDFVDLYSLANRHRVSATTFRASLDRVAQHRKLTLEPLATLLVCRTMLRAHLATTPASNAAMVNKPPTMYRYQQARFSRGKVTSRADHQR